MPEENIISNLKPDVLLDQNVFSKLAKKKKYEIKRGLFNFSGSLANVCFMNSVLQILLNMPELVLYFLSKQYDKDKKVSGGVADAFRNLILNIINKSDESVILKSLENLRDAMGNFDEEYKDGGQHDAYEFLSDLFICISKDLNTSFSCDKEYKTLAQKFGQDSDILAKFKQKEKRFLNRNERNLFLSRLFYHWIIRQSFCVECGSCLKYSSTNEDIFNVISDIYNNFETLDDGIKLSMSSECDELIFCKKCNKEVQAYIKERFVNAPNYLLIKKNRLEIEGENIHEIGVEHPVEFPANDFSLGDLVINKEDQDAKYDLVSVVFYSGNGNSGHYTNYSKKSDGWYYFSDSYVNKMPDDFKINEDKNIQNNFYYLVYKKKDMRDKDLFEGYDINDFFDPNDPNDLKIISELEKSILQNPAINENENNNNNNNNNNDPTINTDEKENNSKEDENDKPVENVSEKPNPNDFNPAINTDEKKDNPKEYENIKLGKDENEKLNLNDFESEQKPDQKKDENDKNKDVDGAKKENNQEQNYDLDYLLKTYDDLDQLQDIFFKAKNQKDLASQARKNLSIIFSEDRSRMKKLGDTEEKIDLELNKLKKEMIIYVLYLKTGSEVKKYIVDEIKKADNINWLRRIWQTIKSFIMLRFSEIGKAKQGRKLDILKDTFDKTKASKRQEKSR